MTTQVAFLFPGQGSQAVGMGADVYAASAAARQVFDAVDEALGFSLSDVCFHGPEPVLRETINAQPAIVTVSLALLSAFQESLSSSLSSKETFSWSSPLTPRFVAGHSVGEWTALAVAGVLDLREIALVVRERGRLMDHEGTVCPGGMAAVIGMEAEILMEICQEATQQALSQRSADESGHPGAGQVVVAHYNAPGQIVLSGEQKALALASELAKARGAKRVIPLAVSGAFHSPVMLPAARQLAEVLVSQPLRAACIPVIGNRNAAPLTGVAELREELAAQVADSVQWVRTIEYLVNAGVTTFIEIGPGQALTGMIKRIVKGATTLTIGNSTEIQKAVALVREMGASENV
jgi:[acyl-carrier-protein] S-malonyltransferase